MVNQPKSLSDASWKGIAAEFNIKDRGLHKALERLKRLEDHEYAELSKVLGEVARLASQLQSDKAVTGAKEVSKRVAEVLGGAESMLRDVAKAQADYQGQQQANAEDGDDDDAEQAPELLTTKMVGLLRQVAKGETLHALVALQGKNVAVMLAKKSIPTSRRALLCEHLGTSAGVKWLPGHCLIENGCTTFVLKAEVSGLAARVKAALFAQTGLRLSRLRCRGNDGEDAATEDATLAKQPPEGVVPPAPTGDELPTGMVRPFGLSAAVGRAAKNLEDDVMQVQGALNRRLGLGIAVNGRCGKDTLQAIVDFQRALGQSRPDGRVDPGRSTARALAASGRIGPPPPAPRPIAPPTDWGPATVARAPKVWHGTRRILGHNVRELKRAIAQQYASEHPGLLAEIDQNVARVDVILEKLDHRLSDTLDQANAEADDAARGAHIEAAKAILADYIRFVRSEPLIDHVDNNPFDVDTKVRKVITDSLRHLAKSIS